MRHSIRGGSSGVNAAAAEALGRKETVLTPGFASGALGVSFGVVAEAAGVGVVQGLGEGGEGGALAFAGGLGQVFDGGLEDGKVADEGGAGSGSVLGRGGLGQEGLEPLGVEALRIAAVAEGVGVARRSAAAPGRNCFLVGTNKGQISHGSEILQFPLGRVRQPVAGNWLRAIEGFFGGWHLGNTVSA